jgi:hypothetical protein
MELEMKLEGGNPPVLDTGSFTARITGPDNSIVDIPFTTAAGGFPQVFSAQFIPPVDGVYTVEYLAKDATYKGAPYTLSARLEVNVRVIPAIVLEERSINLGIVEAAEVERGIIVPLRLISSSVESEEVEFEIAGMPGVEVVDQSPALIPPGESQVYLTIQGKLPSKAYQAALLVTAREGLDLQRHEIPLHLTVYQPLLTVARLTIDTVEVREDKIEQGVQLTLSISSTSRNDETVAFEWDGEGDIHIESDVTTIPAEGNSQVTLRIRGDNLQEGLYNGQIKVIARQGVHVSPPAIDFSLLVVPVTFCTRWCLPLGGIGVVVLLATAALASILASRDRLAGALKPIKVPAGQIMPTTILLSSAGGFFHPAEALIGSGAGTAIRLPGGNVRPRHAVIKSNRTKVLERIGRPARNIWVEKRVNVIESQGDGLVKVNNVTVPKGQKSVPLRSGMKLQIGEYEFEYRD